MGLQVVVENTRARWPQWLLSAGCFAWWYVVVGMSIYSGLYHTGQDQGDSDDIDRGRDSDGSVGVQHHILAGSLLMCATVMPRCSPSLMV